MNSTHSQFIGSIPKIYDRHLGPLLFEFSAEDLARRVAAAVPEGGRVLEVACGTGISTDYLARALRPGTEIVASDLNQAMIDYAVARRGALPGVSFQRADALDLPYAGGGFDAVVCQFGVMFFPDKAKGLAEMARVLKPGGVLAFNVWDSPQQNPCVQIAVEVIARYFEDDAPVFLQMPFGCSAIDPIKEMIQDAGFRGLGIHVVQATIERPDAHHVARGLVEGNPGVHEIRERATADVETVVAAVAEALHGAYGPEPLRIPLQEIVYTALKP